MPSKTYTTSDIAQICDVYPSTINDWINGGKLKAYSTPGGHHRITREDLVDFLSALKIPIPQDVRDVKTNVLIVEDDASLAKMIERAFLRDGRGFNASACGSGIEALIRIGRTPPDLVILDLVLPKMDGAQVCKILKSAPETRDIKIIVVTGKASSDPAVAALKKKVDGFFSKPLDVFELVEHAAAVLKLAQGVRL